MKKFRLYNIFLNNKIFFIINLLNLLILILHYLFHDKVVLNMGNSLFYADEEKTLFTLLTIQISSITGFLFLKEGFKKKYTSKNLKKVVYITTGLFFIILGVDEYLGLHEHISTLINNNIPRELPWIIIFSPIIIFLLFLFSNLVKIKTAKKIKILYTTGIFTFLLVLLLETIGGYVLYDRYNYMFLIIVGIEEYLEILGISLFLQGIYNKTEEDT